MITCSSAASLFSELKTRIETRQARVGVIGLGYVGLPLALLYTEAKFRVTGFDIDQHKVATLTSGGSYICRIPPTEIQAARSQGFCATADFSSLTEMDAIIICVPTPLDEYREPDLSFITNTCQRHSAPFACRSIGGPREHDLSRHHGGSACSNPGGRQWLRFEGRPRRNG